MLELDVDYGGCGDPWRNEQSDAKFVQLARGKAVTRPKDNRNVDRAVQQLRSLTAQNPTVLFAQSTGLDLCHHAAIEVALIAALVFAIWELCSAIFTTACVLHMTCSGGNGAQHAAQPARAPHAWTE